MCHKLVVLGECLGETETWIHYYVGHSHAPECLERTRQLRRHVGCDIGVFREGLHGLRRAPHMHQYVWHPQRGNCPEHGGVERSSRYVVHDICPPFLQRPACHIGTERVYRHRYVAADTSYGLYPHAHAAHLLHGIHRIGTGARGVAPHIYHVGSFADEFRRAGVGFPLSERVGSGIEGVGGNVEYPHHLGAADLEESAF